jgi:hypothetical protein
MDLDHRAAGFRFLVRNCDSRLPAALDALFARAGVEEVVEIPPVQAPRANADVDRWVHTVRTERLGWDADPKPATSVHLLSRNVAHHNTGGPHRGINLEVRCGGLINEYQAA